MIAAVIDAQGALPLPWLARPLERALSDVRGHATLLHGPVGAGLFELAMTLAQGWLCEAPHQQAEVGRALACGRCQSCHLVQVRTHPDLIVLLPDALRERFGWTAEEDDSSSDGGKQRAKASREIKVELVRAAIAFSQQSSARGRGKVIVIHPADAMNRVSANALLKTLEEPPGGLRLVLTSASTQALLPTLRSRCQAFRLDVPSVDEASAWLRGQGVDEPAALLVATGGQPLAVLDWLAESSSSSADLAGAWLKLPERVAKHGDAGALASWPVPRAVDALIKLCHDAVSIAAGGSPRFFPKGAVPGDASLTALTQWSKTLAQAARHDEHPWNAPLFIEALVTQGRRAWQGPSLHSSP